MNESALLGNSRKTESTSFLGPFSKHASVKSEMSHNSLSICDDMTVEGHDNEGQHRECFFGRRVQHARKFCGLGWYQTPARAQIASHTVGYIGDNDNFWPAQTNQTVLLTTPPNLGQWNCSSGFGQILFWAPAQMEAQLSPLPQLRLNPSPGSPARVRLASKFSPFFPTTIFFFLFSIFVVVWGVSCGVCVQDSRGASQDSPPPDPPKNSLLFFHSPATFFVLSPSLGCPYFGWCFEGLHPRMCTLGLSNSKRAHFKAPALQTQPKFHEKTPERERENKSVSQERETAKKSSKIWAPNPSGPLRAAHHRTHPPPQQHPPTTPPTTNTTHNEHQRSGQIRLKKMAKCGQKESVPSQSFFRGKREGFVTEIVTDTKKTTDKNDPFSNVGNNHGKKVGGQKWGKMQCGVRACDSNTLVFMGCVLGEVSCSCRVDLRVLILSPFRLRPDARPGLCSPVGTHRGPDQCHSWLWLLRRHGFLMALHVITASGCN